MLFDITADITDSIYVVDLTSIIDVVVIKK